MAVSQPSPHVTTLIFDVDDTLYDVDCGFSTHRNGEGAYKFMVDRLRFPDMASAAKVKDSYFQRHHATAKALLAAEREGQFPDGAPKFHTEDLAEYWATKLDYSLLCGPKTQLAADLRECPLKLVAFSNGPRKYVKRVLVELGLWELFGEERLFAVDDVLPHAKPDAAAFQTVFDAVGATAEQCVMVEDSMKNIRRAKELGVKTVLITGSKKSAGAAEVDGGSQHRILKDDAPDEEDPSVDCSMEGVDDIRKHLPCLWESNPAAFVVVKP